MSEHKENKMKAGLNWDKVSAELSMYHHHISSLKFSCRQKEQKVKFLLSCLEKKNEDVKRLQEEVSKLVRQVSSDENIKQSFFQKVGLVDKKYHYLDEKFEDIQKQLNTCNKLYAVIDEKDLDRERKLTTMLDSYSKMVQLFKKKTSNYLRSSKFLNEQVTHLQNSLDSASSEHKSMVKNLNETIENLRHDLSRYQDMLIKIEGSLISEKEMTINLKDQIADLKDAHDNWKKMKTKENANIIQKLQEEIKKLDESYNSAISFSDVLEKANAHLKEEVKDLSQQKKEERMELEKTISDIKFDYDVEQKKYKETKTEYDKLKTCFLELEEQKRQLEDKLQKRCTKEMEQSALETQVKLLQESLFQGKKKLETIELKLKSVMKEKEELAMILAKERENHLKLEQNKISLEEQKKALEQEKKSLEEELLGKGEKSYKQIRELKNKLAERVEKKQMEDKSCGEGTCSMGNDGEMKGMTSSEKFYQLKYLQLQKEYSEEMMRRGREMFFLQDKVSLLKQKLVLKEAEILKLREEIDQSEKEPEKQSVNDGGGGDDCLITGTRNKENSKGVDVVELESPTAVDVQKKQKRSRLFSGSSTPCNKKEKLESQRGKSKDSSKKLESEDSKEQVAQMKFFRSRSRDQGRKYSVTKKTFYSFIKDQDPYKFNEY